jgi:hypothetical protein
MGNFGRRAMFDNEHACSTTYGTIYLWLTARTRLEAPHAASTVNLTLAHT